MNMEEVFPNELVQDRSGRYSKTSLGLEKVDIVGFNLRYRTQLDEWVVGEHYVRVGDGA